jgi:hypothetical protein
MKLGRGDTKPNPHSVHRTIVNSPFSVFFPAQGRTIEPQIGQVLAVEVLFIDVMVCDVVVGLAFNSLDQVVSPIFN